MKKGKIFTVPYKRKRQGRTYYRKRLKILMSNKYRLVVRSSLRNIQISIVEYSPQGDMVKFTVDSKALAKFGWRADCGNIPSAYLIGFIAGKKSLQKEITEAVMDIGFNNSIKGSRFYAALAGVIDAGLKVPFSQEMLPSKDRISGEHIAKYANELNKHKDEYTKQFSDYLKRGLNPEEIVKHFNEVRARING